MHSWDILGISPTKDEDSIRHAYMERLGLYHPEEDPEGFQRLRATYEAILKELEEEEAQGEPLEEVTDQTSSGIWLERVKMCYNDFSCRRNEKAWIALLEDEVCYQLDDIEETSEKLLAYLMNHFRLPNAIWRLVSKHFQWEMKWEELYRKFPTDFINFVRNSIYDEDRIDMDLIEVGEEVTADEIDEWIRYYIFLVRYYNEDNVEKIKETLRNMENYDIYHPKIELVTMYYLAQTGCIQEAVKLGKTFMETHSDYLAAYYTVGEVYLQAGLEKEGIRLLERVLEETPTHFYVHMNLANYYLSHPEKVIEGEKNFEVLEEYFRDDERARGCLEKAYPMLIHYYEEEMDLSVKEHLYQLAIYYRGSGQAEKCEAICHKLLHEFEYDGKVYYLLSKLCVDKQEIEEAIIWNNKWLDLAKEEEKAYIYEKRSLLYNYLKCYDKALEDIKKALSYDDENVNLQIRKLYIENELEQYQLLKEDSDKLIEEGWEEVSIYFYNARSKYFLGEYGEAVKACREVLRINVYEEEAYEIEAKIYYQVGQYEDVLDVVDKAKSYGIEDNEELLYYEAISLREVGEEEQAREVCYKLLHIDTKNDKAYYLLARLENDLKHYEKALEYLEESIKIKPMAFKFKARSNVHEKLGQYEAAILDYDEEFKYGEEAGYEADSYADLFNNKGYIYAEYLKDDPKAFECYEKVVEYKENHNRVYYNLGEYYERCKDYEKALIAYDKQIGIEANDYYYIGRAWCYISMKCYERAREDFNAAIDYNPENAYAYNGLGYILKEEGNDKEAIAYFEKAIELDASCMIAYENLGDCLNALEAYEKAIENYTRAIEQCPEREYCYISRGNMYRSLKQYEEALSDYKRAEEIGPDNYYIYFHRGVTYYRLECYEEAIENYKKVVAMNPKHAYSYCYIADSYDDLQEYDEAIKWYEKAVSIDPNFARAYRNMGVSYSKLNLIKQSLKYYQKAVQIDPEEYCAISNIGSCYKDWKEYDKAIEYFTAAIEIRLEYIGAYSNIAECYSERRQYDKAIEWLEKALEIDPEYARGISSLGFVYYELGQYDKANEYFYQAINIKKDSASPYQGLGLVQEKLKNYHKAYEFFTIAAEKAKNDDCYNPDIERMTLMYLKNYEECFTFLKKQLEKYPNHYGIYKHYANVLKAIGEEKEAITAYKTALEGYQKEVEVSRANACTYYSMAECYKGLGNLEIAEGYYNKAIQYGTRCNQCDRQGCYEGYYELGKLYETSGSFKEALKAYEAAALIRVEDNSFKEAIERVSLKINKTKQS